MLGYTATALHQLSVPVGYLNCVTDKIAFVIPIELITTRNDGVHSSA